ncbi:hypothetical protein MA16_Dca015582 [Dendrobium catenatum]|uniref:RIN4 pathogenic type III effector avirulence factor Avr cleavage site domain-containing protein n=1 Tax=Dendrobium catenatum TaxID=906689 RepID=A0A2I0WKT0_9ASPA|nr:hypothetical protein MA16_Dca015582 [Dendrobium catenatum]
MGYQPTLRECERTKDSLPTLGECERTKDSLPTLGECERMDGSLPTLGISVKGRQFFAASVLDYILYSSLQWQLVAPMEGKHLTTTEAWTNYLKGLNVLVRSSSKVFNGGSRALSLLNGQNKGFKEKPLVINEGGLLNNKVGIVVPDKGKDILVDRIVLSLTEGLKVNMVNEGLTQLKACEGTIVESDNNTSNIQNDFHYVANGNHVEVKYGKKKPKSFVVKRNLNNGSSVAIKKVYFPKQSNNYPDKGSAKTTGGLKANPMVLGSNLKDREELNEVRATAGNSSEILEAKAKVLKVTDSKPALIMLNKFDVLSDLVVTITTENVEMHWNDCVEEGEFVVGDNENVDDVGLKSGVELKLGLETFKVSSSLDNIMADNTSSGKKVKLLKELKLLGSGAKERAAALYLKEFIKENDVFFVGLVETKINSMENFQILSFLRNNWDSFIVPSDGLSGELKLTLIPEIMDIPNSFDQPIPSSNHTVIYVEKSTNHVLHEEENMFSLLGSADDDVGSAVLLIGRCHLAYWFEQGNERLSVPAFGEWDGKVGLPDYSIDFSRIREHRRQNKSRVSLGNEDELLNRTSINGDQSVESLKKNLPLHQQHGNSTVVSLVFHIAGQMIL